MAARTLKPTGEAREDLAGELRAPGLVLGIGLGGLIDGIVLHQILQWHHMLTSTGNYPPSTVKGLKVNTLWDGLFHATAYAFVAAGLVMLWRKTRGMEHLGRGRALFGWMLAGWGLFNVVEGIIDHHILGLHHVRPGPNELVYDLAFLAFGAILVLVGWRLGKNSPTEAARSGSRR